MLSYNCFRLRLYFFLLFLIFKFNKWHFRSTYYCSPYKKNVVDIINRNISNSDILVEVGCGIGEIIRRINCKTRIGIDRSKKVINAAKFYNRKEDIEFISGSFNSINSTFDHILLLNFTHEIPKKKLIKILKKIIAKHNPKTIFIDSYHNNYFKHLRHHDFTKIFSTFKVYMLKEKKLIGDGKRFLYVFKKNN
jgi:2-polyprenyl-3-methyl-5-hydroxy-6-metoxy-1,4-benzoquinol methylase